MKSFKETIGIPTEKRGFPTFEESIAGKTIEEGAGTSSKKLQDAIAKFHAAQLELQQLQLSMLNARDRFLAIAKGDPDRDPIAEELKELGKKKAVATKNVVETERVLKTALDKEEVEDIDLDII